MKRKYRKQLERLGKAGWQVMACLVETCMFAARPGSYVFGGGMHRRLGRMEEKGWLEMEKEKGEWVCRLTQEGILALSGGIDPERLWSESWDEKWRMLMFDLPAICRKERIQLHRWLKAERFGCLQGSLWVRPRAIAESIVDAEEIDTDADRMIVVEGSTLCGYTHRQIVAKAWNFTRINKGYREYLEELYRARKSPAMRADRAEVMRTVIEGWIKASEPDPFLPRIIEPGGYLGRKAWNERRKTLEAL